MPFSFPSIIQHEVREFPAFFLFCACSPFFKSSGNAPPHDPNHIPFPFSLRKQPTFREVVTWTFAKRRLSNERRNSILMTRHYPDLGCASDWLKREGILFQPIRSTTYFWVVTQTSFCEGLSGDLAKRRLFSQAISLCVCVKSKHPITSQQVDNDVRNKTEWVKLSTLSTLWWLSAWLCRLLHITDATFSTPNSINVTLLWMLINRRLEH